MKTKHGFELIREQDVPEINTNVELFRHVKTGAELLSLKNDDENKVFGVAFRTPPPDSTGLPHILEHAVLGGSRRYPVKEPFVELLKGSLQTFVNAFTSPDKTSYPVASQNVKDLYNLIDVYLDAVFYPRITPSTFLQEGWHYELESLEAEIAEAREAWMAEHKAHEAEVQARDAAEKKKREREAEEHTYAFER